jgi:hypothetical protein
MNPFSPLISGPVTRLATLTAGLWLAAGCGERTAKLTADQSKSFDSAPAEVKQTWEKALAAEKASDYLAAQTAFDSLQQMYLSDPQRQVLETECSAFGLRLGQAVEKNDPAAVQALQKINNSKSKLTQSVPSK